MPRYRSTGTDQAQTVAFREALFRGQAPDGGLYVPESLPQITIDDLAGLDFAARAGAVMQAWLADDLEADYVAALAQEAFDFPVPLVRLDERTYLLELFHGPTAAFKDFGARFMAHSMARLRAPGDALTVLVATSGDTGSAVAQAFAAVEATRVVLLYPAGMVSPLQEAQLTAVPDHVTSLRVSGTFDDCQTMVKAAFRNDSLVAGLGLTSANSINIGRLLPQTTYYVHASLELVKHVESSLGSVPLCVVPSGNLGNLTAGLYAQKCGAPIQRFLVAANRNDVFPHYLNTGVLEARATLQTPSNAMDVGNPSNAARILDLYHNRRADMRADLFAHSIDDEETLQTIREVYETTGRIVCPHTAVGLAALAHARREAGERKAILRVSGAPDRRGPESSIAVVLATAHPGKFAEIVGRATGHNVELPTALEAARRNRGSPTEMEARPEALFEFLSALT